MNMKPIFVNIIKPILAICLLATNVITYAASIDKSSDANQAVVYSEDKQNIAVTIDKPSFDIKLKSNPTTGYSWFLREYNPSLMVPVKHIFLPPGKSLIGASGYEVWTFRAKTAAFAVPQITTIRMTYARPWQSGDSSTQIVFHVTTQGK